MVVLIVGMSLGGYILYKFLGQNAGIFLGGVLGGIISSTAATVSYSRQARGQRRRRALRGHRDYDRLDDFLRARFGGDRRRFARLFSESVCAGRDRDAVDVRARAGDLVSGARHQPGMMPDQKNPTQLKSAVIFGAMYVVVLFALAAAKLLSRRAGLVHGRRTVGLDRNGRHHALDRENVAPRSHHHAHTGWQMIVVAIMANMVSKTALAGILGGKTAVLA